MELRKNDEIYIYSIFISMATINPNQSLSTETYLKFRIGELQAENKKLKVKNKNLQFQVKLLENELLYDTSDFKWKVKDFYKNPHHLDKYVINVLGVKKCKKYLKKMKKWDDKKIREYESSCNDNDSGVIILTRELIQFALTDDLDI